MKAMHWELDGFQLADAATVRLRLSYTECGPFDGPVYLILHGYTGSHHVLDTQIHTADAGWGSAWVGAGKAIDTNRYRVLTINLPGSSYGSDWLGSPDTFATVDSMARAIVSLLDELGIPRLAGVVGYSFGGYVALTLNSRFPERMDRVLGLCTSARGRGSLQEIPFLRGLDEPSKRYAFRSKTLMNTGLAAWMHDHGKAALDRELDRIRQWSEEFTAASLWRLRAAAATFSLSAHPPGATMLYASSDTLFPPVTSAGTPSWTVPTPYGHQALLLDPAPWIPLIARWAQLPTTMTPTT